jgi:hypothetical protein
VALKAILAVVAVAAIAVGFVLPGPGAGAGGAEPRSQIAQIELHR